MDVSYLIQRIQLIKSKGIFTFDWSLNNGNKTANAIILSNNCLKHYSLDDWKTVFATNKGENNGRAGVCRYRPKEIGLSFNHVLNDKPAAIQDTILHEIAHALTPGCHHNQYWVIIAKLIGCNGKRCYSRGEKSTTKKKIILL